MTRCGWCGHNAVMILASDDPIVQTPATYERSALAWMTYRCPGCGAASLAQGLLRSTRRSADGQPDFIPLQWYPKEPLGKDYPDSVPSQIASVAAEAHGCLSVGHHRATIALARAVVEATAKEKGITVNGIAAKIDALFDKGLIYEHVKDAAHEVRFAGNEVAHGDLVDQPPTEDEAAAVLEMMDMVLDGVYIAPGKTAAQRAAREARKAARQAGGV